VTDVFTSTEEMISQDPVMRKLMHGKSSEERNAFMSMMKKNSDSHKNVTREYVGHWEANGDVLDGESARDVRKGEYMSLVNKYVTIRGSRSTSY
jgi:sterol 24-C-methyltransferase